LPNRNRIRQHDLPITAGHEAIVELRKPGL